MLRPLNASWWLLLLAMVGSAAAQCEVEPPLECDALCQAQTSAALVQLREAAGGSTWLEKPKWDAASPCGDGTIPAFCCWKYVQCCCYNTIAACDVKYGVQGIDIKDNNVTGTLTGLMPSLRVLSRWGLHELAMEGNALTGPIPQELTGFNNFTRLALGSNREWGSVRGFSTGDGGRGRMRNAHGVGAAGGAGGAAWRRNRGEVPCIGHCMRLAPRSSRKWCGGGGAAVGGRGAPHAAGGERGERC